MNIENGLVALTQWGATWVLWLLVVLSVVCLAVIAERSVCYFATRVDAKSMLRELGRLAEQREWATMLRHVSESPSFEARVAAAGLAKEGRDAEARMRSAEEAVRVDLEQNLAILGTIGANAPFVGLLGTVIGIIGAFRELQKTQGLLSGNLMSEIGEALVATAVGLLVALPAVAAFNLFRRIVQQRLSRAEMLRHAVVDWVKLRAEEE